MDNPVLKDLQVWLDNQEIKEQLEILAIQAQLANLERMEIQVNKDLRVPLVMLDHKEALVHQDQQDQEEIMVVLDLQDLLAVLDPRVQPVRLEHRVRREILERKEM
jgi:hypothetical protein